MNCDHNRRPVGPLVLGLLALCLLVTGCGYGPIGPTAYEHAKELYTLSNLKAADSLEAVEAAIEAETASGELTPREAAWLTAICKDCRAGAWDDAQAAARRMLEDQVQR